LSFLSPTDDPRMLGRFGGYEIAGVVGCGGMGVVLKGLDVALNRYVAIKALAPHLATSAAARLRFAREARAAAAVVHENVIAIHAVAEANGLPYLVMPYVRGPSLQKRLDAQGPLATAEILRIGRQAAAGLAAAHAQGLVHRDIKPGNILLEDGVERLTITDFGLARAADDASLTRSGVIAGTPQFMSPEQARGDSIDARSDLFSLGSVLYSLCTGRAPFRAETSFGVLRRITDETPRPISELNPEIPAWLTAIISRLHAKDPAARYGSADEVAQLFEHCLAHIQQPTMVSLPASLNANRPELKQSNRRGWWLAGIPAVLVLAAVGVFELGRSPHSDNQNSGNPAKSPGARTAPISADKTRWNDGTAEQLFELQSEINDLDVQASAEATIPTEN
jgi:serine/threonine-protein kinase